MDCDEESMGDWCCSGPDSRAMGTAGSGLQATKVPQEHEGALNTH